MADSGNNKKLIPASVLAVLPWVLMAFAFCYAMYFVHYNYYVLINGDTSPELQLGKILSEEGGILSDHWRYSSELTLLNCQLVYKIVFMFIKDNWMMVRMVSNGIMFVIYSASYLFMMRSLGMFEQGKWTAWMLLLPFGTNYGYIVLYGCQYLPQISVCLLAIGLVGAVHNSEKKVVRIIAMALLLALAFVAGLGGARHAMICYIPMVLASFILMFVKYYEEKRFDYKLFVLSCISFVANVVGTFLNSAIFADKYGFVNQSTAFVWGQISINKFLDIFSDYLSIFGLCWYDAGFMGVYGAVNFMAVGFIALWIVSLIVLIKNRSRLSSCQFFYVLHVTVAILFSAFVYSTVKGEAYWLYHWVVAQPIVYPLFAMAGFAVRDKVEKVMPLFFMYVLGTFLLVAHITLKNPIEPRIIFYTDGREFVSAIEPLKELKSTEGFAPRWMASVLVEMTNGEKDIWVTSSNDLMHLDDLSYITDWLQDERHAEELPKGSFFVVTYGKLFELDYPAYSPLFYDDSHLKYADKKVTIYEFEDMDDYRSVVEGVKQYSK